MPQARIFKDKLYRTTVAQCEPLRNALRFMTRNEQLPGPVRFQAQTALNSFPISARKTAVRNRCLETGRARWVLRDFGLTRHAFLHQARNGLLPGVGKSSW
ncbi:40S ribosomal protein mrp2, mitochondrial [Blastocladiella emersonii ATCC 22665]|nr:40S ribosomal protein mrp2, mitochondrial [Blastocladiella emersonii ATCC 22665]